MVGLDCKMKLASSSSSSSSSPDMPRPSPLRSPKPNHGGMIILSPRPSPPSATAAYEQYLRLPELSKLLTSRDFCEWDREPVVKPALQALEITFRFISVVLSDPRPYSNRREWSRRLESLAAHQIELVAAFCEGEGTEGSAAPTSDLSKTPRGVLARDKSSQEVWTLPGSSPVVSRTSEESLLPRLATWDKSEGIASRLLLQIESQMRRSPFTLGLGEPNLAGKPNLEYDLVCRPTELHSLKLLRRRKQQLQLQQGDDQENQALYTAHQIMESWVVVARALLRRIEDKIDDEQGDGWEEAASDCWLLERIWKLLAEIEDLHLLLDPNDFLRLKHQLSIKATSGSDAFCFRSAALMDVTRASKGLKRRVPGILGVEVDPEGGPRVQEAAMRLFFHSHSSRDQGSSSSSGRIHLLQAFQAVDAAVKKFFFSYRQLIVAVMGSLEAAGGGGVSTDSLSQLFMEPPYFPSLDAAKTFLGEFYEHGGATMSSSSSSRR